MQKIYDVVVKTGEYQDRNTGETKAQWKNVGAVMKGENGPFLMLDRTFNPAGLPNPEDRSNCLLSLFTPKDAQQPQQPRGGQPAAQPQSAPQSAPQGGQSQYPDFDDGSDIPFNSYMKGAEYMV